MHSVCVPLISCTYLMQIIKYIIHEKNVLSVKINFIVKKRCYNSCIKKISIKRLQTSPVKTDNDVIVLIILYYNCTILLCIFGFGYIV